MNKTMTHNVGFMATLIREFMYYRSHGRDIVIALMTLLASMIVVAWIFTSGRLTSLPVAVIDQDNSSLSRTYVRMIDAAPQIKITQHLASPIEARELLASATIYTAVLIPRGFGKNIKTAQQVTVPVWYTGQFLTIAGVITKTLRQVTGTLSASIEITSLIKRGESNFSAKVNFEPIASELRTLFNPFQNYQYFLVTSLLPAMLQVFVMVWTVVVIGREFCDKACDGWRRTPNYMTIAVAAKICPIFIVSSLVGLSCLFWVHGVVGWPVNGRAILLIIGWELMIAAYISLGICLVFYINTLTTALSFTAAFTAPAFAYAGMTFPQQSMPFLAQLWTYALPVRTLLRLQVEQAQLGAPMIHSMSEICILLGFIFLPLQLVRIKMFQRCKATALRGP